MTNNARDPYAGLVELAEAAKAAVDEHDERLPRGPLGLSRGRIIGTREDLGEQYATILSLHADLVRCREALEKISNRAVCIAIAPGESIEGLEFCFKIANAALQPNRRIATKERREGREARWRSEDYDFGANHKSSYMWEFGTEIGVDQRLQQKRSRENPDGLPRAGG